MDVKLLLNKPDLKNYFNLSVSKAKTYKDCKAKFKFGYIEKLPKKERDYHKFGKFLHEILENLHKEIIAGNELPHNKIMTICYNNALKNWEMTQAQSQEAFQILVKYLKNLTNDKSVCLKAEKEFFIEINEEILLQGFIDKVQRDEDGIIHVVDYKTAKSAKFLEKDFLQLLTYAYALFLEDPSIEKIRASYLMLRHDCSLITREFSVNDMIEIKDIFFNYAQQIKSETEYLPSPSPLCSYCDFVDNCETGNKFISPDMSFGLDSWGGKG